MRYRATFAVCLSFAWILPSAGGEPILIGHRGLLRHAPENTMPALATCIELSFGFELDVYSSRDNQLVVIHNENLQGTTNGPNRPVGKLTVAELQQLDAGSWFHPAFKGVRIPTFEEVLAMGVHQKKRVALFNFSGSAPDRRNPAIWDRVKEAGCDGMLTDFPLQCRLHWWN
ncbi:MAG: glycerophosphodiester phosphodiesterase [Thermoguttaceae bacterium]|jgi:glycerophosphoryl diester phosphodiesterase